MGENTEPAEGDQKTDTHFGLVEEFGGLFLQASPCAGLKARLPGTRDSGYESLHRQLSVLDRLVHTHTMWLQLGLSYEDATCILMNQPTGTFIVRKSASLQRKVISLRMDKETAVFVKDFPVKESQYTFSLEGSGLSFGDLFHLVAFCCISRDVLPFPLKLPETITLAKTSAELEEVAKLGAGFWDAQLCHKRKSLVSLSRAAAPNRPPPPQSLVSLATTPTYIRLQTRTPSELECCQPNGALCFINPLFIKVHHPDRDQTTTANTSGTATQCLSKEPVSNNLETNNKDAQHCCSNSPQLCSSDHSGSSQSGQSDVQSLGRNTELQGNNAQKHSAAQSASWSPPPRPPLPHFIPQCSALPVQQHSMPEKISWIKEKVEDKERNSSLLSRLGSSLSISPLSSPPKRLSLSSPISIPWPSLPVSLSSLSSSPCLAKASPPSSQEDAQCHLALEDHTIEEALQKAQKFQHNAARTNSSSPPDHTEMQGGEEEAGEECSGGSQRLSDMSLSTDSSDSLDFSQSLSFFLSPLSDLNPPTQADFNTHLPLSIPPSDPLDCSMDQDDDDEEEEEEDENEEESNYCVSLESDQNLTMVPPGHRTKRCPSASALALQRALQGPLHKMSGVFNSLLTPEKRMIRRVVELSKDKDSYFGSLVQDYLSYMGEGAGTQAWQSFASRVELLQTLRQFITQMKSYLRQSSEMDPPIESLIPEDQIDRVLEKAMHKCVLKPLKPVVSVALQEFQVRSTAWQELKENLSLAKAQLPQEMGVASMLPPDPVAIEKIKHKFHTMCKLYSPEKKVTMLLRVCKLIYTIMEENSGRLCGADDFLPMLTYVLAQCDMPQLDNEILYMMELLDPSLLHGEGGYYLTSAYGAMSLIRNFQEDQAARVLSSETRDTLHQWHRRRTAQRSAPSIDDFQVKTHICSTDLSLN
nr:ras and Rab interactor 2-like isoform X2 [Monopterus albus]